MLHSIPCFALYKYKIIKVPSVDARKHLMPQGSNMCYPTSKDVGSVDTFHCETLIFVHARAPPSSTSMHYLSHYSVS